MTRAVFLLEELARQGRPVGIAELARSLDLAKSTVANLCTALEGTGMIRRVDGRWALGHKVVELGQGYLAGTDAVEEFRRTVGTLPVASRELVVLAVLDGTEVVYLARHEGLQSVRPACEVGMRMPAVVTALGKAVLASLPPGDLDDRLARVGELPVLTAQSHRTFDALRGDLDVTRERGFAVDNGEYTEGVTCVGVTVPGRVGVEAPTAVGAILLAARMTPELRAGLVADLTELAGVLSRPTRF